MENYAYAESGGSSPRSRHGDSSSNFESPRRPCDDQLAAGNNKVKFMCSYGGKILPRPHDNQLSYVGGETKILAVDRFVRFGSVVGKLTTLCEGDVCFKYQLPGEDLDALISVTNDDDLEHMMHEYDRLNKGANGSTSSTTARLRLFLFPVTTQSPALTPVNSFSSVDALNQQQTNRARIEEENEVVVVDESDHIQKHIHDLQSLRIAEQQQQQPVLYRKPSNDNLTAVGYSGDYLVPKMNENEALVSGYQISGGYTVDQQQQQQQQQQQPVYMVQAPGNVYHAPMATPGQGYYVQRMPTTEVYHEQQVYNVMPPVQAISTQQTTVSAQQQFLPQQVATYTMVQSTTAVADQGYGQVAYDNGTGRQIYYTNQGTAVVAQQQQPQQLLQPLQQNVQQQYQAMAAAQENGSNVITGNLTEFM